MKRCAAHTAPPGAASPARWEYAAAGAVLTACFLLFAHPDILETANHTWLFLEHIFSGRFLSFYEDVLAHENGFYYVNAAHYNVFLYAVFGVWMLPVYAVSKLAGALPPEAFLALWAKGAACLFAIGCGALTARLASRLGLSRERAHWAAFAVLLSPITVFAAFTMGQYDSVCLFFLLLALLYYLDGRLAPFAFVMGFAVVCKMFALLVFIPLLVLREKRVWRIALLGLLSLWLWAPTSLLFAGRGGDMQVFNDIMTERLFAARLPGGLADIPLFLCLLAGVCAACWFFRAQTEAQLRRTAVYVCLCVFALLFLFVSWHPQWLILLVPFLVLTTAAARVKTPWYWLDIILCAGFFLLCYLHFPNQLEVNLLDNGLPGVLSGLSSALTEHRSLAFYFGLFPYVSQLAPVLFAAPLLCSVILKFPAPGLCPADRLAGSDGPDHVRRAVWGTFAAGYGCLFLAPCAFQWLKCFVL